MPEFLSKSDLSTWYRLDRIEYINNLLANTPTIISPVTCKISFRPPRLPKRSKSENTDLSYVSWEGSLTKRTVIKFPLFSSELILE